MAKGVINTDQLSTPDELEEGGAESQPQSREEALQQKVDALQSQLSQVMSVLGQVQQKTGIKSRTQIGEVMDADANIPLNHLKAAIIESHMKPGSFVGVDHLNQQVDRMITVFTTDDGKTHEMPDAQFRQMIGTNKTPVKVLNALVRDRAGHYRWVKEHKPGDLVKIRVGRMVNGERMFDDNSPVIEVKYALLNA